MTPARPAGLGPRPSETPAGGGPRRRAWLARLALFGAALACLATSRPRMERNYPSWKLEHLGQRALGCTRYDVYVKKSGKTGVGIVVAREPLRPGCRLEVTSAVMDVGGERVSATARALPGSRHLYLPFEFDNESAWNDDRKSATLELRLQAGGDSQALVLPMRHEWTASHVRREPDVVESPARPEQPQPLQPSAPNPAPPQPVFAEPPP